MTTEEKCREIVKALLDMVNTEHRAFSEAYAKAKKIQKVEINGSTVELEGADLDMKMPDPTAPVVQLGPDWGGNAMTIYYRGKHSHAGLSSGTFEEFVHSLYMLLCENKGLSWE